MTLEAKIAAALFASQSVVVIFVEALRRHLNTRLDAIERKLDGISKSKN